MKKSSQLLHAIAPLLFLAAACAEKPDWTILSGPTAARITDQCSRPEPAGLGEFWTPSLSDVGSAERKIDALIKEMLSRAPAELREHAPRSYIRQYVGFMRNGRKVLYVNAQATDVAKGRNDRSSWRSQPVTICDGGLHGFGAIYDLGMGRFDWFSFDGSYAGMIPMNNEL